MFLGCVYCAITPVTCCDRNGTRRRRTRWKHPRQFPYCSSRWRNRSDAAAVSNSRSISHLISINSVYTMSAELIFIYRLVEARIPCKWCAAIERWRCAGFLRKCDYRPSVCSCRPKCWRSCCAPASKLYAKQSTRSAHLRAHLLHTSRNDI